MTKGSKEDKGKLKDRFQSLMVADQEWKTQIQFLQSRIDELDLMKKYGSNYEKKSTKVLKDKLMGGLLGRF